MNWPTVDLQDVTELITCGVAKRPEYVKNGIPFLSAKNVKKGKILFSGYNSVSQETHDALTKHNKPLRGDILYTRVGSVGEAAVIETDDEFSVFVSLTLIKVKHDKLNNHYLKFLLNSEKFKQMASDNLTGIGVGNLNVSVVRKFQIPLPPLSVQKQIVAVLEKADTLRGQCQQMEQELNTLAQSVFLAMFGDPVTNPNSWITSSLEQVCHDIYRYPTFYGFDYVEKGVPVVKIGNITKDGYVGNDLRKYDFMPSEKCNEYPRTILKMFDIVMAVRGDGSTGKRIGLVDSDNIIGSNISPNLIMFRANNELVHPVFLYYFLTSKGGQAKIDKYITKTAKKSITGKDIKKIEMYVPPLKLQLDFVRIHMNYRKQLLLNRNTINFSSSLFNSLMQRAFKGELELKDVA